MDIGIQAALFKCGYHELRSHQSEILKAIWENKDCLLCAPTGSGKSLIFEMTSFVLFNRDNSVSITTHNNYQNCLTVVVSPLVSLMRSQTSDLNSRGISTLYLGDIHADSTDTVSTQVVVEPGQDQEEIMIVDPEQNFSLSDVYAGKVHILFGSAESLLSKGGRTLLKKLVPQIKCIVVDEAHCIKKYGYGDKKRKRAFRPQYRQLHQLRAIIPESPCVALTATATSSTVETILKDLAMSDYLEVKLSPHKENIKYSVVKVGKADDFDQNLNFLVDLVAEMGINTPRTLIFFKQMSHLTGAYEYVDQELGKRGYINWQEGGVNDDRNHLIEMYIMKTEEDVKTNIVKTFMNPNGHIKVVFCSASFSMGLNLRQLDTVIHYGVPADLDDYLQQTGRAGRDENHQAHAVILYHRDTLKGKNMQAAMKDVVKTEGCRRVAIYKDYVTDIVPIEPAHKCCDNCAKSCKCSEDCDHLIPEVIERINKDKESSSSDKSSSSGENFTSDNSSEIEVYHHRKPTALQYSSESSD